jgi:plasmid stabilization system protein ParE
MARKITWTETAYSDLESVFDFISRDSTIYDEAMGLSVDLGMLSSAILR